jgi:hypothetical protein
MLNIAKSIYTGTNARHVGDLPEAEIIPYGESTNEKKKLQTLTKKYNTIKEHDNVPLPGFTLYKPDRKSWGSINQTWLIIDPRGFLVRITCENLNDILHVTGITEGLIQEKCVWARENSETRVKLIPVSSRSYKEATENTELIENKVSIKDVQIGDTVLLQNKLEGVYMGVASLYSTLKVAGTKESTVFKVQTFLRRQILKTGTGNYYFQSDLKILKVIEKSAITITREDAVESMCNAINDGKFFSSILYKATLPSYQRYSDKIKHVSISAVQPVCMELEPVDITEAETLFYTGYADYNLGLLLLEDAQGYHLVNHPYSNSNNSYDINNFDTTRVSINDINNIVEFLPKFKNHTYTLYNSQPKIRKALNSFTKFYKIINRVKNNTYI